jgi:hypothetical protein
MYSLKFDYDRKGKGDLILLKNNEYIRSWPSRTGSINQKLELVNALEPVEWQILTPSEWTTESAMCLEGKGWKIRLFTADGRFTHYLIHPDGRLGGTLGCIGIIGTIAIPLKDILDETLKSQLNIPVHVSKK